MTYRSMIVPDPNDKYAIVLAPGIWEAYESLPVESQLALAVALMTMRIMYGFSDAYGPYDARHNLYLIMRGVFL